MEYATLTRPRTLTADEATALIGDPVQPAAPNLTAATIVVDADSGEPAVAYLPCPDIGQLRRAIIGVETSSTSAGQIRADGTRVASRTFGYAPRRPVYRQDGCRVTALADDYPDTQRTVMAYATRLREVLDDVAPGVVASSRKEMTGVDGDWKMGESEWTSGVINRSARLPYHRDAMNFPVWSAMPVVRRHMEGGHLAIPEYDLVLPCRDGWGVFFPGYKLVHGVTPMRPTRPDGYRFSLVYYALRGMQDCFTYAAEREHARTRRTQREQEIARKLAAGETIAPRALTGGLPPGRGTTAYFRHDGAHAKACRALAAEARAEGRRAAAEDAP
jgi:hypothetical protein